MLVNAPLYEEVRSVPMSKPNHAQRWYDTMSEQWADQQEHLTIGRRSDGTPKATPNGLVWNGMTITSSEVMPFCELGSRLYLIALPGFRSFHIQVDTAQYELRANVPLDFGRKSILVFDEKVARVAFPIHGRMVYGHRIGELFTDSQDNIWEEVWRNAKAIHEEKETHTHKSSRSTGQRNDTYLLTCSLGRIDATMLQTANAKKAKDPREIWEFGYSITPYVPKEGDAEQVHFYYLEICFKGAGMQITGNDKVIAEIEDETKPLYVAVNELNDKELKILIAPKEDGLSELTSMRIVECVHELVQ